MGEQRNNGVALEHRSVERLAAAIVAGMIREAAYRGEETNAAEISRVIVADPEGATASYFRRAAADSLDWIANFRANPEVMALFSGANP